MSLRRVIAVTAAAAAARLGATAAVSPGRPAARPPPLPALTAPALDARYAADSRMIAQAARAAGRAGNQGLASALEALRGQHFLDFNPRGPGLAVEVLGDLARARRVAILLPRSDTSLTTFDSPGTTSPGGAARALAAQARPIDPRP